MRIFVSSILEKNIILIVITDPVDKFYDLFNSEKNTVFKNIFEVWENTITKLNFIENSCIVIMELNTIIPSFWFYNNFTNNYKENTHQIFYLTMSCMILYTQIISLRRNNFLSWLI